MVIQAQRIWLAAEGLAPREISIIEGLAERYPDAALSDTLMPLLKHEGPRGGILDTLDDNPELTDKLVELLAADEDLKTQIKHLATEDPEKLQSMLEAAAESPDQLQTILKDGVAPVDAAKQSLAQAAAAEAEEAKQEGLAKLSAFMKGDIGFGELLGPGISEMLENIPIIGPLMKMMDGLFSSNGFIGQALDGDGPFAGMMKALGMETPVTDVAPETGPVPAPAVRPDPETTPGTPEPLPGSI